jgi:hypothetical protein
MLVLYLLVLFPLYAIVTGLMATSPYEGVRTDVAGYAVLSGIAMVSVLVAYLLTVGRAPWAMYASAGDLVVRERFGRVRRFPIDESLRVVSVRRSPASFFSPEPTETVQVSARDKSTAEYVVGPAVLAEIPEIADARR